MSVALAILLFPLKLTATIILFILKIVFSAASFLVLAFSLPFVMLAEMVGGLLLLFTSVSLGAMLLCWYFGSFDGKTVLIVAFFLGLISTLLLAAEAIAEFICGKMDDIALLCDSLIGDMW